MGNLSETATWEDVINQIETTDALLGGSGGPLNIGPEQLANRTQWLRQAIGGYVNIQNFAADHTFAPDELYKALVVVNANNATLSMTLPDSAGDDDVPVGFTALFTAINVNKSQVSIIAGGSDTIQDGSASKTKVFLGDGDAVQLIFTAAGWRMLPVRGHYDEIGGFAYGYQQAKNTLIAQGQLVNRADYPRLWEWAQTLSNSLVSDFEWSNSGDGSKGYFSTGNGSTTFRMPDLRGMFIRGLDLGAGIDSGRPNNYPGAYEADDFKAHTHTLVDGEPAVGIDFGNGSTRTSYTGTQNTNKSTGSTGGTETRPKNRGLLPLIKV